MRYFVIKIDHSDFLLNFVRVCVCEREREREREREMGRMRTILSFESIRELVEAGRGRVGTTRFQPYH